MSKRRAWIVVASLAWLPLHSQAMGQAGPPSSGPEDVARASLRDLKEDRIEAFAQAMHPESLTQLQTALLGILDEATRSGKATEVLSLFEGAKTTNDLKAMNPVAFMAAYLRGSTKRIPGYKELLKKLDMQVVGHVVEGKDKVYVIYRSKRADDAANPGTLKVIGLRQNGAGWGMLLDDDLQVLLFALKQKVAGAEGLPKFDLTASQVELLGQIAEGTGMAHEVFRLTTPLNESRFSKVSVLTVRQTDPEWAIIRRARKDEITRLIEQSMGIKPIAPTASQTPNARPK